MFNPVDIIAPSLDIDFAKLSFDPEDEEFKAYEMAKQEEAEQERLKEIERRLTKDERIARDYGFELGNIAHGPPIFVRKKMWYQGHASTTYSLQQATNIIDFLGKKFDSEDCLPFAVKLIEDGQLISVAEDNGEYACGKTLANSLKKVEGFNVLVCVTRCVKGSFVSDIVQNQKNHAVQEAANQALSMLYLKLTGMEPSPTMQDAQEFEGCIDLTVPNRAPSGKSTSTPRVISGRR